MESRQFKEIDRIALSKVINPIDFSDSIEKKHIKNFDTIFSCHPSAEKAFLTWYELTQDHWRLTKDQNPGWIGRRYANFLEQKSPLLLIADHSKEASKLDSPHFLFFNLFGIVRSFLRSTKHEKVPVILLNNPDPSRIEYYAWREVVKLLFSEVRNELRNEVLNKDYGIPDYRDLINKNMPTKLKLEFFHTKNFEVEQLIQEIEINRRQYDYQVAKRKSTESHPTKILNIFFPQILKDAKHVDP